MVVGLGQSSLDYIVFVDEYPPEDTKKEVTGLTVQGGGPVATALVSLSRLKVKTSFIGVVSDDGAGNEIKKGFKKEGVSTGGLVVKRGGSSQVAFIVVNKRNGKRTIFWQRPGVELEPGEIDYSIIKKASFLLLDGLMKEASLEAARLARRLNIPVMLDAGRLREGMLGLARLSDYIVASEEFARELSGTPLKAIKTLAGLKPFAVTVTLGEKGSMTWAEGRTFTHGAFGVKAIDTTGAGDVFHGGYIYGILKGFEIEETVRFASAFAALKCLKPGGRAGIPSLEETLSFMKKGLRV